jgi:two-component system cell cycle sensor histidine kinase/response regulator CckA
MRDVPRIVLDHLHEGLQVVDRDYRYVYVNDAVARQGKTNREALIGRTMMEAYPGIEHTKMFAVLRRAMTDREHMRMENEFVFDDGSRGWFDLRFEPIPEGLAILSFEITDRKRTEAALRRAVRAMTTLSQSNRALVRATEEGRFLHDVCGIVVRTAGYDHAYIGLTQHDGGIEIAAEAGTSPAPMRCDDAVRRAISTGQSSLERDESSAWIALPICERDTCYGALAIHAHEQEAFDARERELLDEVALDLGYGIATLRARRAHLIMQCDLEEATARARAVYDHLPHGAFVWRRDGNDFVLDDFNDAARAATADGVAALVGKSVREIGKGIPHLRDDLERSFGHVASARREVRCVLPGASMPRHVVLTYGYVPPDAVLLHTEDITEQRRTEEQLAASQRLDAIGRLAGGVAHDFNNLVSVILTYAGFAMEQLHETDPIRSDIEEINLAADRAAQLTRQLLAFSRRQVLDPRPLRLDNVVRGLEKLLCRLLGEDVEIASHSMPDLGSVMADPGQLEQVLMNLAVNARDAMPQGGKLTIEMRNVELDGDYTDEHLGVEPGRYVMLAVSDSGQGMDAETRSRVFEPFFTTKQVGKGTGLGLSTVHGIVNQSGGHVWCYSEPWRGTTFKIYLPRVDTLAEERTGAVSSKVTVTGSETILVVEDEDAVRRAAERILRTAGYRVLGAASAAEALILCERFEAEIELLLTDVVMPQMSGRELADRLRAERPSLAVLYTSGYTDDAIVRHGVLEAGTNFIGKPFAAAALAQKVRDVLDGRPA